MNTKPISWIDEATLQQIEASERGLTSQEILELLARHGLPLTEATLRKYVQLGLLPRSIRVGEKGKHRGSKGLYPVRVVRQIQLIKQMMAADYTIERIQNEFLFLRGELDELEEALLQVTRKLGERARDAFGLQSALSREVKDVELRGKNLVERLRALEERVMGQGGLYSVSGQLAG